MSVKDRLRVAEELEKILPDHRVTSPREFNSIVAKLEASGLCNLVPPVGRIDHIADFMAASFRVVWIDVETDTYRPKFAKQETPFALRGDTGVMKLAREAEVKVLPSERLDDRLEEYLVDYRGNVTLRSLSGKDVPYSKDRCVDLRPASAELEQMVDRNGKPNEGQRRAARQNITRLGETKAQLRAIRAALGLKQLYSQAELARPFVVIVAVAKLDLEDPVQRNLAAAHAIDQVAQLYGRPAPRALPAEGEPVDVTPAGPVIDAEPDPEPDLPPPPEPATDLELCACPCGCDTQLTEELAEHGGTKLHVHRCRSCWPSAQTWDVEKHAGLADDASLEIPGRKDLTAGRMRELVAREGGT